MREGYGIGELALRAGVPVANIRYYEDIGILPRAGRGRGGQRRYDDTDVKRLRFVKNCRDLGFPLKRVRSLLHLSEAQMRTCNEARELAAEQLALVRRRLSDLRSLETALENQVGECDAGCLNGPAPDCSIFGNLSGRKVIPRDDRCVPVSPPVPTASTRMVTSASRPRR